MITNNDEKPKQPRLFELWDQIINGTENKKEKEKEVKK